MTQPTNAAGHLNPDQLTAFIDGELPSSEAREIELHLGDCHHCALRVVQSKMPSFLAAAEATCAVWRPNHNGA